MKTDIQYNPNFELSETHNLVSQSAKDFAKNFILPYYKEWDEKQFFPKELLQHAGEMGFMGVLVPEVYGGSGLGYFEYTAIIEEISKVDPSMGLSIAAHNSLCTNHIYTFGSEEQRNLWLPKLCAGEFIGAWGLTEPNTGSDAARMKTTAIKDGNDWVLNGTKNFITHGISGDILVVIARTGDVGDSRGMTAFVVEYGTPGLKSGKKENKLGMRASETSEIIFNDCRIPDQNRLGEVGDGFIQSMKILDGGRISIGALALGMAEGAMNASISYSKEREQFGKPIAKFQGVSFKLADMATEIEASKLLLYKAAYELMNGGDANKFSAMAKYKSSEVAVAVANEAVQVFGGYGYIKEYPVEKFYRDSKLATIGEGTSEIQKLVISRAILSN